MAMVVVHFPPQTLNTNREVDQKPSKDTSKSSDLAVRGYDAAAQVRYELSLVSRGDTGGSRAVTVVHNTYTSHIEVTTLFSGALHEEG